MDTFEINVKDDETGQRIDKLLSTRLDSVSRAYLQQLIKKKFVNVNGKPVKSSYQCRKEDMIVVHIPEPEPLAIKPEQLELDIVFEDDHVIVVNKPRGMVVHPAPGNVTGTLVNGLLAHCQDLSGINGTARPGIVHRIDKDTSGLLMVAKNDEAHISLARQLQKKSVTRKYTAIVHGVPNESRGMIDAPIARDENDRKKMAVSAKGKEAVTHFRVLKRFVQYSLIECQLETGRTHQIRVHMKYIGFPIAGDPKYGPKKTLPIQGQALHAGVLGFEHPKNGEQLVFSAPIPADMQRLLDDLRKMNEKND